MSQFYRGCTPRALVKGLGVALALTTLACSRDSRNTITEVAPTLDATGPMAQVLSCRMTVKTGALQCETPQDLLRAPAHKGVRLDQRIIGGQGIYVRLVSSGVSYAADVFSVNVTVQNLTNLSLGTSDGATRHANGLRVFFHQMPTATNGVGDITVTNPDGTATFTGTNQPYMQYGGTLGGVDQNDLGSDGILAPGETSTNKNWQFNIPASVIEFSFQVFITTETAVGAIMTTAPQVTSISTDTLVPGATAVLTGINFNTTPANNTVRIGGATATVTAASATELTITVPCINTGSPAVQITTDGKLGAPFVHPLKVANQQALAVGQSVVFTSASQSACSELLPTNEASRYIVSVFNAGTNPVSSTGVQISGDFTEQGDVVSGDVSNTPFRTPRYSQLSGFTEQSEQKHYELLERNKQMYEALHAKFANDPRMSQRRRHNGVLADPVEPPVTRTIRMPNINSAQFCSQHTVLNVTRVYYNGKIAIYEDDATPSGLKASANATMQDYYNRIGDQFNADMEPVIRNNFGDVLLRDAVTDNNGVLIAVFSPHVNNNFSGFAGFVVSCDQYPNDGGSNASSNFGEYFYAYQPTSSASGFGTPGTQDFWYRTIRSTFIHETKHVASHAARAAASNPNFEENWLEEGTARHSEELWGRLAVDNMAWKGDNGYGSAANPVNIYCDYRPTGWPECASNPRRPANIMQRHFSSLYTQMFGTNASLLSPFGRTPNDNASYYYALSWSLVRYAIDRYGVSDAAFLTALNQATSRGITNLTARAGVSIDQLLGGWSLALAADNHPLLTNPHPDSEFPTWNFRSIYSGLNADFPGDFSLSYPLIPVAKSFGAFDMTNTTTIYGGGVLWYEISGGTHTNRQLLRLLGNGGGALSNNMRMAILRVQ